MLVVPAVGGPMIGPADAKNAAHPGSAAVQKTVSSGPFSR
jgi:hypothetical protein